jgi:phosphoribosylglycinamide formyltransferase 1
VHYVDNEYDHGPIILQRTVPVMDEDTPEALAARVFAAECEALPEAIRKVGKLLVKQRDISSVSFPSPPAPLPQGERGDR